MFQLIIVGMKAQRNTVNMDIDGKLINSEKRVTSINLNIDNKTKLWCIFLKAMWNFGLAETLISVNKIKSV